MKRLTFRSCKTKRVKYSLPKKPRQTFVQHENRRIRHGESKEEVAWLTKLGVPIHSQVMKIPDNNRKIGSKYIVTDGYDPKTNTVMEFLGGFYHGDPRLYKLDAYNTLLRKYNRELYYGTIERFKILHELGYKVFFVWEQDYKKGFLGRYYYYYDKIHQKWDDLL